MKRQLNLAQLIFLLSRIDPKAEVRFDFGGFKPTHLESYRGDYSHLALGFGGRSETASQTAEELLEECRQMVGRDLQGYKGGTYTMGEDTPVWVANWGDCHDTALVGVIDRDNEAILETAYLG